MPRSLRIGMLAALAGLAAAGRPALAAEAAPAADLDEAEVDEVVVTAARPIGSVEGDIKPEIQLGPAEIRSFGVSSVSELLDELAPQIRSDAGRGGESSVVLVNGRRISSFNEIRDVPTEAILRVEVLPEDAALRYGFSADQRVVNVVLRRRFRALTTEATATTPTQGGQLTRQGQADETRIRGDNRMSFTFKLADRSLLTEDERGVTAPPARRPYDLAGNVTGLTAGAEIDPALSALVGRTTSLAGVPGVGGRPLTLTDFATTAGVQNQTDIGRFRSLQPKTHDASLSGVLNRALPHAISANLNFAINVTGSDGLQGLPGVGLTVPHGDPFSPFGQDVRLYRYVDALGPLKQASDGWGSHLGGSFGKDFKRWRGTFNWGLDHNDSINVSDIGLSATGLQGLLDARSPSFDPFGPLPAGQVGLLPSNKARSISDSTNFVLLASGPLFKLPAGQANASLKLGDNWNQLASRATRSGLLRTTTLSRNDLNFRASLDLPIASRSANVLDAIGDVGLNLTGVVDELSDYGTLTAYSVGLRWTPIPGLRLLASRGYDETAPSTQQLNAPTVVTEGVRVFDFVTGRTVDVSRIDGGSPGLKGDNRRVLRLNLNWKPFSKQDLSLVANYVDSRIENTVQTLSTSPDIQAAFPSRFVRDSNGDLTEVDSRPANFASRDHRELRWGINFTHAIGPAPQRRAGPGFIPERFRPQPPPAAPDGAQPAPPQGAQAGAAQPAAPQAGAPGQAAPSDQAAAPARGQGRQARGDGAGRTGGGGGFRGGGFGGGGGGGPQQGRLQLAFYHTVIFEDRLLVRPGGPALDLLNGASFGGGGVARHQLEAQALYNRNGLGARLTADWKSGYTIRGGGGPTGDLDFSDLGTLNLRLFADFTTMRGVARRHPMLRGTRLTFGVSNLFNTRVRVKDATGVTPLSYQPAYLDPVGRSIRLNLRKQFF